MSGGHTSAPEPTVYIVEDDDAVRDSLSLLLSLHGLRTMVFASAEEFLRTWGPGRPGCLVLDLRMPGMTGLELLGELQRREAPPPVIVITAHGDVANTRTAFKSGAVDFFEKPVDDDALVAAIRSAVDRDAERRRGAGEAALLARGLERLTAREREVLDLVAAGLHNREIAQALGISPRTVEVHKARVMEKLGLRRLPDLIRLMERHGRAGPSRGG
jgi:RNA polymerase sigma factor (sigma-70 family)